MDTFAVLGPCRGGTSAVTGILRTLGVFVGNKFYNARTGYETYEAEWLKRAVRDCFDETNWHLRSNSSQRVRVLREWWETAKLESQRSEAVAVGGKHPLMCMLIEELSEAWSDTASQVQFISVIRSKKAVINSWKNAKNSFGNPWYPRADIERVVGSLIATRDAALASRPHILVDYEELLKDPSREIQKLAFACGLPDEKVALAVRGIEEHGKSQGG